MDDDLIETAAKTFFNRFTGSDSRFTGFDSWNSLPEHHKRKIRACIKAAILTLPNPPVESFPVTDGLVSHFDASVEEHVARFERTGKL